MGIRWRGYEHPELYTMINAGPGAAASDPQTQYWKALSEELGQVDEDLNGRLNQLGSRWEGMAAESAQSGLTPLAAWAGDAETGSTVMKVSSENQGEYISDARARMPAPVEVTTQAPSTWDVFTAGAALAIGNSGPAADVAAQAEDHEAQEAAKNEAEQRALETMRTYESSSTWNRETLGTFVAPPDVVVETPAPRGGTTMSAVMVGGTGTPTVRSGTNGSDTIRKPSGTNGTNGNNTPILTVNDGGTDRPPTGTGGGGTGGGGGTKPPVIVGPPGTTTPSDVFVPPPGGGNPFPNPLPTPPGPGPGPYPPGQNPFPVYNGGGDPFGNGGGQNNAGDVARKALPLQTPRPGGPLGPGGMPGGGAGGFAGGLDGERSPSQLGRGLSGVPGEGGVVRNSPGAAGAAGGRGAGGVQGPAGAGGRRADGEDDDEHFAPDYLMETDDVFGDDRRVSPTVIGE